MNTFFDPVNNTAAVEQLNKELGKDGGRTVLISGCIDTQKKGILRIIDFKSLLRCAAALTIDTLLVNVLLGTYWCSIMYGKGFAFYLSIRFAKNMIQLPINIILTYYVLGFIKYINNKIYE